MLAAWEDYERRPHPEPERAAELTRRLLEVRRALRLDLEARPPRARGIDRVRVLADANPPQFSASVIEGAGRASVSIPLGADASVPPRPVCDRCSSACVHGLAAIDELLDWLFDEAHERRDEVLAAADTVPWRRWLDAFDAGIAEVTSAAAGRQSTRLWWTVDLQASKLTPYVRTDGAAPARRIRLAEVERVCRLAAADRGALAAARLLAAERRAAERDGRLRGAFTEALSALIDHPRVAVGPPGGSPWRVEQLPIRFTVHERGEHLEVEVRAGAHRLEPADLLAGDRVMLFEQAEARTLSLVDLDPTLRGLLKHFASKAVPVPVEARAELMRRLSEASIHVAVEAGDQLRDLEVVARPDLVALLTPLPERGLFIDLRARPLPDGPLFRPGWGPEQALASTPDRNILRARRDLEAEARLAEAVLDALPVEVDPEHPHTASVLELADALDVAEQLRGDPRVECQWPTEPWYPPVPVGVESLHLSVEAKRDWFDVHGGVQLDGRRVELAVLVEAARRDRGYVPLDDGHFLVLDATLRDRLLTLAAHVERKKRQLRVALGGLERLEALTEAAASVQTDEAYTRLLERIASAQALTPEPEPHLQDVLRPYQREGFAWLARLAEWGAGAVLADDMGLGKTIQAIAILCRRAERGPQLVVAPTSVGFNWGRELARFAPDLEVVSYAGPDRGSTLERARPGSVFVTSYGVAQRDAERLRDHAWTTLVLDEAQALKNPKTRRSRALRSVRAEWTLALTGTPVENHPADLWAIFHVVFPGLLGSFDAFRQSYLPEVEARGSFEPLTRLKDPETPTGGAFALRRAIAPFVLRRTKAEVAIELPPRTEIVVDITLSPRERALYDDARLAAVAAMEKMEVSEQTHHHPRVLAALTRLRQLACHPRLVDPRSRVPSSKLERLLELIEDLRQEGRRALVFSQFTSHLALVREALDRRGIGYAYLDGATPPARRVRQVDAFQRGEHPLFLVSLKAGGTGLNLTAADTVFHLDPWWNPAVEDQATDRAHRIGQTQPVTVMRLVARDTIEHKMLQVHADKRRLFSQLLADAGAPARLTSAELMALIHG